MSNHQLCLSCFLFSSGLNTSLTRNKLMFLLSFQREPHTSTNVFVSWQTPWSTKIDFNRKAKSTWMFTYNLLSERFRPQAHMWFQCLLNIINTSDLYMSSQIDMHMQAGHGSLENHPCSLPQPWWVTHMVPVSSTHLER